MFICSIKPFIRPRINKIIEIETTSKKEEVVVLYYYYCVMTIRNTGLLIKSEVFIQICNTTKIFRLHQKKILTIEEIFMIISSKPVSKVDDTKQEMEDAMPLTCKSTII